MDPIDRQQKQSCPSGCPHCSAGGEDAGTPGGLQGWALVAPCLSGFLLPLALAIVGAYAAGRGRTAQFLGATVGLLSGVAAALLIKRLARRTGKEPI